MSDLKNLTRHGRTLGPPEVDDFGYHYDAAKDLQQRHRSVRDYLLAHRTDHFKTKPDPIIVPQGIFAGVDLGGKDSTVNFAYHYVPITLTQPGSAFSQVLTSHCKRAMKSTQAALYAQMFNEEDSIMNDNIGMGTVTAGPPGLVQDDRMHMIKIDRCNNGFTMYVGCQLFVFETLANLNAAIKLFYEDPAKARKKYLHNPDA